MTETGLLKRQLVDCIRMLEHSDIIDYNGHASIRISENRMLINVGSCQRSQLTVSDICTIDFEGNVIEGDGRPPLEFHLHAGIYKARSDVQAVVHAHPKWSTFLTMVGERYEPVYAQGTLVYPMPVLDSPNSINNPAMAQRLATVLVGALVGSAALQGALSLVVTLVMLYYQHCAKLSWRHSCLPTTLRKMPTGNIGRCKSASPTHSAKRKSPRARRSSGQRTSSLVRGITSIPN